LQLAEQAAELARRLAIVGEGLAQGGGLGQPTTVE
jgi:hypothetical protein